MTKWPVKKTNTWKNKKHAEKDEAGIKNKLFLYFSFYLHFVFIKINIHSLRNTVLAYLLPPSTQERLTAQSRSETFYWKT